MTTPATLDNLLDVMHQDGEVLNGWDAVMNLLESDVNQFFKNQWNKYSNNTGKMTISQVWCAGVNPIRGGGYETTVTQFNIELGPPLFEFPNATNSVAVTQKILGGTLKQGTMEVKQSFDPNTCNCKINDPRVTWGKPQTIDTGTNPTLSGTVPLEMVQGVINATTYSLLLDFAKGAFQINKLNVTGVKDSTIADQMKDWFAANKIQYLLASLDFKNSAGLAALTPTSFQFRVVKTDAGNTIVQLLITTNGTQPKSGVYPILEELVPTASGLTCSLMISSRIVYEYILAAGFNHGSASFKLQAISPPSAGAAWYATITPQMHFAGSFSFGSCCDKTTVKYSIYLGGNYTGSTKTGFNLNQHVNVHGNAPVDITVFASYPVSLTGSGANQKLNIKPGTPSVTVTGSVEGEIKSRLQSILNTDLHNAMAGISFTSVTAFALETLLFPSSMIKMSQAQVPGDLLIVGTFQNS